MGGGSVTQSLSTLSPELKGVGSTGPPWPLGCGLHSNRCCHRAQGRAPFCGVCMCVCACVRSRAHTHMLACSEHLDQQK